MRRSRALNLPNILTYGRLAAVPAVVALLFWPQDRWSRWAALAIFVVAGVTDYLDGYLARAYAQQSVLGRMLDPIADKLLVAACLLMLVSDGTIAGWSLWAAIVILCREILVSGLREYPGRTQGPRAGHPRRQMEDRRAAHGARLSDRRAGRRHVLPGTTLIGIVLLWAAAILTLYTGWDYLKTGLHYMMDE